MCFLVAFFHHAFDPANLPFVADFLASWAVLVVLPFLEAVRQGRPLILAFPVIHGLLYQTQGAGIVYPLFWAAFILSGRASTGLPPAQAKISQAHAEATLFGFLIGFTVLTVSMLTLQDPIVTAMWQPFPVYIQLLAYLHLLVRPASSHPESGYTTVQATWFFAFLISAISHIAAVYPALEDRATLIHYYVPRVAAPDPRTTTLSYATHVFLQWDGTFMFGSGLLGSLWFAESILQALGIALWNVTITPVLGPGAATAGVLMWREWKLNGSSDEAVEEKKFT
ncbi:hypothetical protein FA95DRAFT_1582308 [Auriscalpium vulgare]|uniref:Uncharacterized protein n=1 Tax=Auriscalpium vulgare TaxID=40419 RepID=A0ACB8RWJ9_9AGAM|nr:hypothetical protein FA95DRAFT_1582308 [Auriscalpium vulgare]